MSAVKILETGVLHASDILYWLDGSTASDIASMQRLPHPVRLELNSRPGDLQIRQAPGKTALWRRGAVAIVDGEAGEADKAFASGGSYTLAGRVYDSRGFYNPRTFSITAGAGGVPVAGHGLVMYPSPQGTRFGRAGGLIATLRYASDESVVPWALLTAVVTIPGIGDQTYRAQADHRGDVLLPLHRLPPLPEGVDEYSISLGVEALQGASPDTPLNTGDLVAMELESLTSAGAFSDPIGFSVVPGEIRLIRSDNKDHLAVQPS
ncbi:hypothetical protein GCM10011348_02980 [Marinobacterium nitratireducens]|uniref:Uncharacterized protein n=1 Tax=Marinobacterium nitratireducens TaxID=518897 RepID=A0A918DP04_9GAMM|nr:carboxypeptidase regulatory-like domain-containing protein [Marinobacterium nitratireducens]GGO76242.1 hypothetical protein GCM10011348_02980 [Marinobacterium nitratireducens]